VKFEIQRSFNSTAGIAYLVTAFAGCGGPGAPLTAIYDKPAQRVALSATRFTIRDLGVVGKNVNQPGQPVVVSNTGWISGAASVGKAEHAVLWHRGNRMDIGKPGLGGNSFAYGVNESGHTAGDAERVSRGSTTEDFCGWEAMGFSSSPTPCVPFVWQNGKMAVLKRLGGVNGVATQINTGGTIAGYAENETIDPNCPSPQKYQFKPVVWSDGEIQALPTGHDPEGVALAINDAGTVVGSSGTCAAFNPIWLWNFQPVRALLWQNGAATDLGNLGGKLNNFAHGINDRNEVVGSSDLSGDGTSHAFLWTAATKMRDLGTVKDKVDHDTYSVGLGINHAGQVVGLSANADFSIIRAFLRQNGVLVDLNSLVAGTTPLHLMTACSINDHGEIIGIAIDSSGKLHGYLAEPASAAPPAS
jgi:probable HAF family extracellular repeat protein